MSLATTLDVMETHLRIYVDNPDNCYQTRVIQMTLFNVNKSDKTMGDTSSGLLSGFSVRRVTETVLTFCLGPQEDPLTALFAR